MAQNFLTCDRDQPLLLPPDLHDWLDEDHLAWFVIEAIEAVDLDAFYASYRSDGHGRAAHDPKMMLTLIAYAYAVGERSSRGIERRCRDLIDEFRLWIFPVVIGTGKRFFGDGTIPAGLKLLDSKVSKTGVTINTYERAGDINRGSFEFDEPTAAEIERRQRLAAGQSGR